MRNAQKRSTRMLVGSSSAILLVLSAAGIAGAKAGLLPPDPRTVVPPAADNTKQMAVAQRERAEGEIDRAINEFPYRVVLPTSLPEKAELEHAQAHSETYPNGERVHSLDVWYRLPSGKTLHIWQTDSKSLAAEGKDPVADTSGNAVSTGNATWNSDETIFPGVNAYSTRVNGVTVSVDFPTDEVNAQQLLAQVSF